MSYAKICTRQKIYEVHILKLSYLSFRGYVKGFCANRSTDKKENTPNLHLDVVKSTSSYETLNVTRNNTAEGTYEHLHPEPATMTPDNKYSYITENAYENK